MLTVDYINGNWLIFIWYDSVNIVCRRQRKPVKLIIVHKLKIDDLFNYYKSH